MSSSGIPDQLVGTSRFIKLEHSSKKPEHSPEGPFFQATSNELAEWIEDNGNVGLNLGELVALDVDSDEFRKLANEYLPLTFSVRSGSGGEHWYYRSDWSGRGQFTAGGEDLGSIRSGNWYTVIPPSIHPNGEPYRILRDREIQRIPEVQIRDFIEAVEEKTSQHSQRRRRSGGGGCVGSSEIPEIPSEYPEEDISWNTARRWLSQNNLLESLNRTSCSDWSGLEFKIAKCLAEGGFSETSISDVLDRLSSNSKWHSRGESYQQRTVRNAILAAVEDEYVDFSSTGDMDRDRSESRKTEESGEGRTLPGGENNMAEFTDKLSTTVLEADEEGDSFKKITLVEGHDGEESFEFLSLKKGQVQEADTTDGETVLIENVQDSVSLGSPDYLDDLIGGLEAMKEELDE